MCFKSIDENAKKFSTGVIYDSSVLILRNRKQYGITREKCQQQKPEKLVLQLQHQLILESTQGIKLK